MFQKNDGEIKIFLDRKTERILFAIRPALGETLRSSLGRNERSPDSN